jgi:hypothetical protein
VFAFALEGETEEIPVSITSAAPATPELVDREHVRLLFIETMRALDIHSRIRA